MLPKPMKEKNPVYSQDGSMETAAQEGVCRVGSEDFGVKDASLLVVVNQLEKS